MIMIFRVSLCFYFLLEISIRSSASDDSSLQSFYQTTHAEEVINKNATAQGLFDNGFKLNIIRSELGDVNYIHLGECLYPIKNPEAEQIVTDRFCPQEGSTYYVQSNFFSSHPHLSLSRYWVIEDNNKPYAFSNQCNSGPPNQSLAISPYIDGNEVINFKIQNLPDTDRKRIYFNLKNEYNPCGHDTISYTSIGTYKNRGNGNIPIAYFRIDKTVSNREKLDPTVLKFNASMMECRNGFPCLFYLNLFSHWNNKKRMLILTFGKVNHKENDNKHVHWNWPVKESVHYPGADIAYIKCNNAGIHCLQVDSTGTSYSISMRDLWMMASEQNLFDDPVPLDENIAIDGVSWSIETTGSTGGMKVWLDHMRIETERDVKVDVGRNRNEQSQKIEIFPYEDLVAHVTGMISADESQSCLEVVGRAKNDQNGEGSCGLLKNWVDIKFSLREGEWQFADGIWSLSIHPVSSVFPPNTYNLFWRNKSNGKMGRAQFKIKH